MIANPSPEPLIAPPFPLARLFLNIELVIVTFPSLKNKAPPVLTSQCMIEDLKELTLHVLFFNELKIARKN